MYIYISLPLYTNMGRQMKMDICLAKKRHIECPVNSQALPTAVQQWLQSCAPHSPS